MRRLRFRVIHVAALVLFYVALRKMQRSSEAIRILREAAAKRGHYEFAGNRQLELAIQRIPSPAVLILNQHALNITLNFLCNLARFDRQTTILEGAVTVNSSLHDRLVVFALDTHSYTKIRVSFPRIYIVRWNLPELEGRFQSGDGRYQVFQYFRARLCEYLAAKVRHSFWMIQADTIWTRNLFEVIDIEKPPYAGVDALFDAEGDKEHDGALRAQMVAGGYFFARRGPIAMRFFGEVAKLLLRHFSTDNNFMAKLCLERYANVRCGRIPYSIISNWRAMTIPNAADSAPFFQFDGGEHVADKLAQMAYYGHLYVVRHTLVDRGGAADYDSVVSAKCIVPTHAQRLMTVTRSEKSRRNYGMRMSHSILEMLSAPFPWLQRMILTRFFPFYAYYFII